jgi:hypothetical protein
MGCSPPWRSACRAYSCPASTWDVGHGHLNTRYGPIRSAVTTRHTPPTAVWASLVGPFLLSFLYFCFFFVFFFISILFNGFSFTAIQFLKFVLIQKIFKF